MKEIKKLQTDWRVLPDQTPSDDWINYRQALRDLPGVSPKLGSDYELDFYPLLLSQLNLHNYGIRIKSR